MSSHVGGPVQSDRRGQACIWFSALNTQCKPYTRIRMSCDAGRPVQSDNWWPAHLWVCQHARLPDGPGQGSQAQQHGLGQLPAHVRAGCTGGQIRTRQPPQNQHPLQTHPGQFCNALWSSHCISRSRSHLCHWRACHVWSSCGFVLPPKPFPKPLLSPKPPPPSPLPPFISCLVCAHTSMIWADA